LLGLPTKISLDVEGAIIKFIGDRAAWPAASEHGLMFLNKWPTVQAMDFVSAMLAAHPFSLAEHAIMQATLLTGPPDELDIEPVAEAAPEQPNVYTDGSVTGPRSSSPIGSFGVWIPSTAGMQVRRK
jgi:hypothetical protein